MYKIILPDKGKAKKSLVQLLKRRRKQIDKSINKLKTNPIDYKDSNIEKLKNPRLGQYSIRISKGDRLFYNVDQNHKKVYITASGKHDLYKLIE